MRLSGLFVGFLVLLLEAACASSGTQEAARAYYSGRPDEARSQLENLLAKDSEARALILNELGVILLDQRDLEVSYRDLFEAYQIMGAYEGANLNEVGAIIGQEASKVWRGDPYEKAMNSYYLGVVNLLRGINDNALAGFKNAIFVDSGMGEERFDCDFAPAYFMEGVAWERVGDAEMAANSFAKARELAPQCSYTQARTRGNLIVLVDVGRGPTKVNTGPHGEQTRFILHPERPAEISVRADGKVLGRTQVIGDVGFQATTRGGREYDKILAGKSTYKTVAQAGGIAGLVVANDLPKKYQTGALIGSVGLLLSGMALSAEADVRHWTTLPAEIQLFVGELPPGTHEIEIVPASGWRTGGPVRETIVVPPTGNAFVYQRILP